MKEQLNNKDKLKIPIQPRSVDISCFGPRQVIELHSCLGPFSFAPEYLTVLPEPVVESIGNLVEMNVNAFAHFVPRNMERDTLAYQHCGMPGKKFSEPFFQVDMVAMSQEFMTSVESSTLGEIQDQLKNIIFEFEPSIAMYELIQTCGAGGLLKAGFRRDLDILRQRYGKPIALLAPTKEKFSAVLSSEFGITDPHGLSSTDLRGIVQEVSGFDILFGPEDFIEHLQEHDGQCEFLLYVRPSDPVAKLKDPTAVIEEPLLGNDYIRMIIRRNALTLNIDNPQWIATDPRRIKDSKAALPLLGMGRSLRFSQQADRLEDSSGLLRAKPRGGVFGAYGQKIINPQNESHRTWLSEQIERRGPYIVQPEMAPLMVIDQSSSERFLAMDRVFYSMVSGKAAFLGGIRILIPADSSNARNGRLHGSDDMITAPIIAVK